MTKNWRTVIFLAPIALLWAMTIRQLVPEWAANPDYTYGYAVPFLCAYLLWEAWRHQSGGARRSKPLAGAQNEPIGSYRTLLLLLLGVAWFLVRFVGEANRNWRFIGEAMAVITIASTLILLNKAFRGGARWCVFPIAFFFVAVPWPGILEAPLVQGLSRVVATATTELLSSFGIPAVRHGNVIEVATGPVGIDEACSGIRSLQATLMISLFFGELYRLTFRRRLFCVGAGFALALLFNLIRTTLLTYVAAVKGMAAIKDWHDPAGVAILVGCFVSLWATALLLKKPDSLARAESEEQPEPFRPFLQPNLQPAIQLLAWLIVCEVSIEAWYRLHERTLPPAAEWALELPRETETRTVPWTDNAKKLLRFDEGLNVSWEDHENRWQAIYLRWKPESVPGLARGHTPKNCLTGAGYQLVSESEPRPVSVAGLELPCRFYSFVSSYGKLNVLFCLSANYPEEEKVKSAYHAMLMAAMKGRRHFTQRSVELAVWGIDDPGAAAVALEHQLKSLVRTPASRSD